MTRRNVWNESELKSLLGATLPSDFISGKIEFNSKLIEKDDIFIALPGANRNGHEFVADAFSKGAKAAIVTNDYKSKANELLIRVENTLDALLKLADYKRNSSNAQFIGITGSVGKTSTKEILGDLLSNFGTCFFSKGNYNNNLGVPLSLCSIPHDTKFCVIEMGMNAKNEISYLSKMTKPHIAVITHVAEAHLEFFNSVEEICFAKCEIFDGLIAGGVAIINRDNKFYDLQHKLALERNVTKIFSFGEHQDSDCRLISYSRKDDYAEAEYLIDKIQYRTVNHIYGKHQALNIAAVLLVIREMGLDLRKATEVLPNIKPINGRGVVKNILINNKHLSIIDDAYNANPASMKSAIDNLAFFKNDKVAVLADMYELGNNAAEFHKNLMKPLLDAGVKKLFTVGALMKYLHNDVKDKIEAYHFNEANDKAFSEIENKLKDNETLLVKGSNGTKIKNFVNYLIDKK